MNNRLQSEYESIEKDNREKFLANNLKLTQGWGKPIWGITLQVNLDSQLTDAIRDFQEALDQLEPGKFFFLPGQHQHISFSQVVYWDGLYRLGSEPTWDLISDQFMAAFKCQDNTHQAFPVGFSKLIATQEAIIWCGYDENDEMERLRKKFEQELPYPEETTKKNHIIHTTVARYADKISNPSNVLKYLNSQKDASSMTVKEILLKKELIFPSIKTKTLAKVSLI